MKMVSVQSAIGMVLCHDVTRIIPVWMRTSHLLTTNDENIFDIATAKWYRRNNRESAGDSNLLRCFGSLRICFLNHHTQVSHSN